MKLWQLALIQIIFFGFFLYVMYTPRQYSNDDNFLQDTENAVLANHKPTSSNHPTTDPNTNTPSSQNSNSTSPSNSTNQTETETSSSTETTPTSSIAVGEPQPSGGTPKAPENPGSTKNSSTTQTTQSQSTGSKPTNTNTTQSNTGNSANPIPDPPNPGEPVNPKIPQNQPLDPNRPQEQPDEEPWDPYEYSSQQPTETSTNTTNATESTIPIVPHEGPFRGGKPIASPSATSTSVKGSEEEPKIIFKSKEEKDKTCSQVNQRAVKLCKMGFKDSCKRYHVSEELSSWWIICPIYTANVEQTDHLYHLHGNFRSYIRSFGINFQTVEVIFPGQKEFLLTEPNNQPYDLQYQSDWIFAMRENLVNVGIKHLPQDWQYMAWIDQHIFWLDPYWFENTILAFSHYNIVHLLNGNDFWNLQNRTDYYLEGFAKIYSEVGMQFPNHDPRQCGLAWGMRRNIFEKLGGLLDICIGTKCDLYQNFAYAGATYTAQTSNSDYADMIRKWQEHAIKVYNKKLGYVDSKVVHFMHCTGDCKTSNYHLHIWALMQYGYNPKVNIRRDFEGRMSLVKNLELARKLWEFYGGPPRAD